MVANQANKLMNKAAMIAHAHAGQIHFDRGVLRLIGGKGNDGSS